MQKLIPGLILFLILIFHVESKNKTSNSKIYKSSDDVIILDADNYKSEVLNSSRSWFVIFYSQWCGHCRQFAPTFKKLATNMKNWNFLKLGTVDCAGKSTMTKKDNGVNICFKKPYFIGGMPDLKFFPPFSDAKSKGINRKFEGKKVFGSDGKLKDDSDSYEKVQNDIINYLQDHHFHKNDKTNLDFLKKKDIEEITKQEKLIIIIEPRSSIIGKLISLDMVVFDDVVVRRLSLRNRKAINELEKMFSVTFEAKECAALVKAPNRDIEIKHFDKNSKSFRNDFMLQMEGLFSQTKDDLTSNSESDDQDEKVYMKNLEIALHYSFRKEIGGKEIIESQDLENLKAFLDVLNQFFPGRKSTMKFIRKVRKLVKKKTVIDWDKWHQILTRAENTVGSFLSTNEEYINKQNFPSAFWQLLHTIVTQYYRTSPDMDPFVVLNAINGYINSFFTCQSCKNNWKIEVIDINDLVDDSSSALLYLWKKHNLVNIRTGKAAWPSAKLCQLCWKEDEPSQEEFDLEQITKFLAKFYHFESISSEGVREKSEEETVVGKDEL